MRKVGGSRRERRCGGVRAEGGTNRREKRGEGGIGGREDTEGLSAAECLPPCGIEPRTLRLYLRLFLGSKRGFVPRPPPCFLRLPPLPLPCPPLHCLSHRLTAGTASLPLPGLPLSLSFLSPTLSVSLLLSHSLSPSLSLSLPPSLPLPLPLSLSLPPSLPLPLPLSLSLSLSLSLRCSYIA